METPEQEYSSRSEQLDAVPSPDNPQWSSLEAIGVWIASVLFIIIIPTIILLPYLAMNGVQLTDA